MISMLDVAYHTKQWLSDGMHVTQLDNGGNKTTTNIMAQIHGIKLLEDKSTLKSTAVIFSEGAEVARVPYRYGNLISTVQAYKELTTKIYGYSEELKYISHFVDKILNETDGKNLRAIFVMAEKDYYKIIGATHTGKEFQLYIRYIKTAKGKGAKTTLTIDGKNSHETAMGITPKLEKMLVRINTL